MTRVQTVVQHDPRRAELLPGLFAALPADARVITDPGADEKQRSPWRCYRACLEALELDASHLLIVQDDAQVCRDFAAAVDLIASVRPADPVCLFVPGVGRNHRRILDACYRDARWTELDPADWVPVVAVVWPRRHVMELLAFVDRKRYPPSRTADDGIAGDWARETKTRVVATVPSLVEHPDRVPSLVKTAHFSGMNPQRCAACWLGEELSPLTLQWN